MTTRGRAITESIRILGPLLILPIALAFLSSCGDSGPAQRPEDQASAPSAVHALGGTQTRPADKMAMVYVPAGTYRIGTLRSLDALVHTVALDAFWIDRTEVTNTHYARCVESGACSPPTSCSWGEPTYADTDMAEHPVICVNWQAARNYCQWAGGRLPTEAEWEVAARGPDSSVYPWGDQFDGTRLNSCDVNCPHEDQRATGYDDGHVQTAPAGSYPTGGSWCGALDMAGNVWEWIADWHAPYPLTRQTNPTGPDGGSERIIRGGSWYEGNEYGAQRAGNRHPFDPRADNWLIGFRCVAPAAEP